MQVAYCPQCGEKICGEGMNFLFSYSGFFNDPHELIKYKIAESVDFSSIQETNKSQVTSALKENGMSATANALNGQYDEKANDMIRLANRPKLGLHFDWNKNEDKQRYIFASELYDLISKEVVDNNRIVDFWLSTECKSNTKNDLKNKMKSIPLIENTQKEQKYEDLTNRVNMFFTPEENENYIKHYDAFQKIVNILNLFIQNNKLKKWKVEFEDDVFTEVYEQEEYIIGLKYGNSNYVKRICPKCGAHISVYLGIYKQKIVSFIGTPTSGKSTVINAIYYQIRQSKHKINGIIGNLNLCDPYYKEYEANAAKMEQKLTVEKTSKGIFPILYALLSKDSQSSEKAVYTFVDVPGEYFDVEIDNIRDNAAALSRINVIKQHSDILCIVIAFEQLLGCSPDKAATEATMAETKNNTLTNFWNACQVFFDMRVNCETVLLISKSDAMKGEKIGQNMDDSLNVKDALGNFIPTYVQYKHYDNFKNLKSQGDDYFYDGDVVISEALNEYTEVSKELMNINPDRWMGNITQIVKCVKDINDVKIFFISSYGFYAINNIVSLPEEEKKQALVQERSLSDDQASEALKIYKKEVSNNTDTSSQQNSEMNNSSIFEKSADEKEKISSKSEEHSVVQNLKVESMDKSGNSGVVLKKDDKKGLGGRRKKAPSREETQNAGEQQSYVEKFDNNISENNNFLNPKVDDASDVAGNKQHNSVERVASEDVQKDLLKQKNADLQNIEPSLNCEIIEKSFLDYYMKKHTAHNPEGINVLVYFFVNRTRFILSDKDKAEVQGLKHRIQEIEEAIKSEKEKLNGFVGFWISVWTKIWNQISQTLFKKEYKNQYQQNIEKYESKIKELKNKLKEYDF